MAQATYKMGPGKRGGYVAYVQVISPLLKERSGKWFVVTPENQPALPDGKPQEFRTLWIAERAARETTLRLAGKVTEMEDAGKPAPPLPAIPARRRRR